MLNEFLPKVSNLLLFSSCLRGPWDGCAFLIAVPDQVTYGIDIPMVLRTVEVFTVRQGQLSGSIALRSVSEGDTRFLLSDFNGAAELFLKQAVRPEKMAKASIVHAKGRESEYVPVSDSVRPNIFYFNPDSCAIELRQARLQRFYPGVVQASASPV